MKTTAHILTACIVCAPVVAMDIEATLPPEVVATCKAEGGCTLYSRAALDIKLWQAFRAGHDSGKSTCNNQT